MKKEILIYEKDKDVLKFLKSFFKEKKEYSAHFVRKDQKYPEEEDCRDNARRCDCQQSGRAQTSEPFRSEMPDHSDDINERNQGHPFCRTSPTLNVICSALSTRKNSIIN